jgi:hypothetical protein
MDNGLNSNYLRVNNADAGDEVPVLATIIGISVIVRAYGNVSGASPSGYELVNLGIAGGNIFSQITTKNGWGEHEFVGDLTYWGINQTEARDFAIGNINFQFQVDIPGGVGSNGSERIQWIDVQFEYEFPAPDSVNFPGVF